MIQVKMPQLGESVAEGTITKWHVAVGTAVKREQTLLAGDRVDDDARRDEDQDVTKQPSSRSREGRLR